MRGNVVQLGYGINTKLRAQLDAVLAYQRNPGPNTFSNTSPDVAPSAMRDAKLARAGRQAACTILKALALECDGLHADVITSSGSVAVRLEPHERRSRAIMSSKPAFREHDGRVGNVRQAPDAIRVRMYLDV